MPSCMPRAECLLRWKEIRPISDPRPKKPVSKKESWTGSGGSPSCGRRSWGRASRSQGEMRSRSLHEHRGWHIVIRHYLGELLPGPIPDIRYLRLIIEITILFDDEPILDVKCGDLGPHGQWIFVFFQVFAVGRLSGIAYS